MNLPIFDPPNAVQYSYLATYPHYVKKLTLDPLNPTVRLVEAELQRATLDSSARQQISSHNEKSSGALSHKMHMNCVSVHVCDR